MAVNGLQHNTAHMMEVGGFSLMFTQCLCHMLIAQIREARRGSPSTFDAPESGRERKLVGSWSRRQGQQQMRAGRATQARRPRQKCMHSAVVGGGPSGSLCAPHTVCFYAQHDEAAAAGVAKFWISAILQGNLYVRLPSRLSTSRSRTKTLAVYLARNMQRGASLAGDNGLRTQHGPDTALNARSQYNSRK